MAKTIDDALALFRSGKSPRECDKLTGINYKKIEREAKKRGIEKGDVSQLTSSMAQDKIEFVSLPVAVQDIVTKDVEELTKHLQFFTNVAVQNVQESMAMDCKDQNEFKARADTILKGKEAVFGKEAGMVINNTNAMQNINPTRIEIVGV